MACYDGHPHKWQEVQTIRTKRFRRLCRCIVCNIEKWKVA